ncbi:short chain dehydrogenase [Exiguobacterium sp. AT1b]|uniref:Short chain dehydrogenase n=1 Tax=Exiguobacterium sp. (strain ATCC BAA-1283 / AT1b) TaxID=360911 RepID=C4L1W8_EXISA|nr:short-chain dehydrogenase/reductase [Exiguobacterium sp. AT1b]ACQ69142.1 short chain dehydrogenase [Exiguobacterium sp. AT1b]
MNRKHILIVGGTGMLAELTSYLAIEQDVTVIGRDKEKMASIVQRNPETCHPLIVDYREEEALSNALQRAVKQRGPFDRVIAWVHRGSGRAMQLILNHSENSEVIHILGSRANPEYEKRCLCLNAQQTYRQVQLGEMHEMASVRWLTHDEIVKGVLDAMQNQDDYRLIGTRKDDVNVHSRND